VAASAELAACLLGAVLLAGGLSGCVSTQQKNARAKLAATRLLEGRRALRVGAPNRLVAVESVGVVRGGRRTAVVVELRSRAAEPLTDLPVAVGVRTAGGRRVVLNARRGLGWFETHVAALDGGGGATWVFTTRRPVPAGRPFAVVGAAGGGPAVASRARSLPAVRAAVVDGRVAVSNDSDVPQRDVQVFAWARRDGRWVAAGRAAVRELAPGAQATVSPPLAGSARAGELRAAAIPTIFE
jgi:hypothetical protein